jgi:hypothetical protein
VVRVFRTSEENVFMLVSNFLVMKIAVAKWPRRVSLHW